MNKITGFLAVVGLISITTFAYMSCDDQASVSDKKFDDTHIKLQREVDKIKAAQIVIKKNQDTMRVNQSDIKDNQSQIKTDLDSLKKGQNVIFDHVTNPNKNSKKEFKDLIRW